MERFEDLRRLSPGQIAFRIRAYRKQYLITQARLSKRLGVHEITLIRWENSSQRISNVMLKLLMDQGIV